MSNTNELARQVDEAQSILSTPAAIEARRIEAALAASSARSALAMARLTPASGASVLAAAGGQAIFAGAGSPLTQELGVGLSGPVAAEQLDRLEAHLRQRGATTVQLELCPFADPSLPALLAQRGYRIHEWQLVWTQSIPRAQPQPPPAGMSVRRVEHAEHDAFLRTVIAGFLEDESVPDSALELMRPSLHAAQHEAYLASIGTEPVGGGSLSWEDGVAFLGGSGVRRAYRGRGAQGALIRARLARARELACELVVSSTLPGTASRRNMERHGFAVAYPKLVLLRD